MAGAVLERELRAARSGRIEFDIARPDDDPEIRRLLRENATPGAVSISLEREPDYFLEAKNRCRCVFLRGDGISADHQAIVARDGYRVVCVGSCSIRERFVNGAPLRVGYLGGLRLESDYAGRFDILRRGYEFFHELQTTAPADYYFTSVAEDNERARRFLEGGVRGMPSYEFLGNFVTLVLGTSCKAQQTRNLAGPALDDLCTLLNEHNHSLQFAPCWSQDELASLEAIGLRASDYWAEYEGSRIVASAALWDQRGFKQTVIRGYTGWLGFARPFFNAAASLTNRPRLPAIGEVLSNAFVSHLAVSDNQPSQLLAAITALRAMASQRRIEFLTLGFAGDDPRLAILRNQCRCREYHTRIYVVRWPGIGGSAGDLDGHPLAPEVALL